jgi:GAF domain-containing protein
MSPPLPARAASVRYNPPDPSPTMNTERLLREVERRLGGLPEDERREALDAVREELARERRRSGATERVEVERERRQEAETLREILEAINRQGSLQQTIEEVLKQLTRLVVFDSCSVALPDPDGRFRIITARGFLDNDAMRGVTFRDELSDALRTSTAALALDDVSIDDRFEKVEGTDPIRSWAGIPLLVEGDVIGLLCLDRHQVAPFDPEDLHRAKAVAFSAAAAIRKAQLLEKVRRYAALMERVVLIDQAVFAGGPPVEVARLILEGAMRIGSYAGGLLLLGDPAGTVSVAAASEELQVPEGTAVPRELSVAATSRLSAEDAQRLSAGALRLPPHGLYLVPLSTPDQQVGTLVLVDPDGQTPDDRLMDAFASRAAAAYLHAARQTG